MTANQFTTSSLGIAAFLTASGKLRLLRLDVNDRGEGQFVFADEAGIGPELETAFLTNEAVVPANEFHRQLRSLRRLIDEKLARQQVRHNPRQDNTRGFKIDEHRTSF